MNNLLDISAVLDEVTNMNEYQFAVSEANKRDEIYISLPCGDEYKPVSELFDYQSNQLITNCKRFLRTLKN